ncbi:hypothetical protein chiPu_0021479 [Chiloscyllium punctatum]|uniref:Uncharacterized protein n=1 Tax=Chiloscyllium punctatum TaxID=137246 RepID=A0A401RFY4_CHIPU|nr:hypothetical protein [Chiloscyllium punctatum]
MIHRALPVKKGNDSRMPVVWIRIVTSHQPLGATFPGSSEETETLRVFGDWDEEGLITEAGEPLVILYVKAEKMPAIRGMKTSFNLFVKQRQKLRDQAKEIRFGKSYSLNTSELSTANNPQQNVLQLENFTKSDSSIDGRRCKVLESKFSGAGSSPSTTPSMSNPTGKQQR